MQVSVKTPLARQERMVERQAGRAAGQLVPSSMQMYKRDFAAYVRFCGGHPRTALEPASLARWRTHLAQETRSSQNTINRMLSAVKRLIKEAANQGYVDRETAVAL
jgi:site-specific recombinase XerD